MKKNKEKTENLKTQAEASRIADVSKTAIGKIKRAGTYNFFVEVEKGKPLQVDTNHQDWKSYLHERNIKSKGSNSVEKKSVTKKPVKSGSKVSKKKVVAKTKSKAKAKSKTKKNKSKESEKQKNALNGGVDLANYAPSNIADVKRLTEIQKLHLEMRVRLDELIEIEMMISVLNEIGQNIQSHFVDLPRRVSELICQKLERVGMEKEVEQIIATPLETGIKSLKIVCQKTTKIKYDS